jgi:HK97 gp10 family phage protein
LVKIAGAAQHIAKLRAPVTPEGVRLIGAALLTAGEFVQRDAQNSITEGASQSPHIASLPGQPPNEEFGTLRNNIETVQSEPLKVEVSSNAPYAAPLEFGTSKMAARPYMGPALQKNRQRIAETIAQAVRIVNKGGGLG